MQFQNGVIPMRHATAIFRMGLYCKRLTNSAVDDDPQLEL
jgi:hypothetical protein